VKFAIRSLSEARVLKQKSLRTIRVSSCPVDDHFVFVGLPYGSIKTDRFRGSIRKAEHTGLAFGKAGTRRSDASNESSALNGPRNTYAGRSFHRGRVIFKIIYYAWNTRFTYIKYYNCYIIVIVCPLLIFFPVRRGRSLCVYNC